MSPTRAALLATIVALPALSGPASAALPPRMNIGDATVTEGNTKTRRITLPVTLSATADTDTTATWTIVTGTADGTDVKLESGSVTVLAGRVGASVGVVVKADTLTEPTETLAVSLVPPPGFEGGRTTGTLTILDDDPQTQAASPTGKSVSVARLSANGRYVAFVSAETGIVPGDTYTGVKVFRRDLQTGETILVTRYTSSSGGSAGSPSISADGRWVAYTTSARPFGMTDTNNADDIEVRDLLTQTTRVVSVATTGATGNAYSSSPQISEDGRRVAFVSMASNLVAAADTNQSLDVFVRDLETGTTTLMTASTADGSAVNGYEPAISGDGAFVAFVSNSNALTGPNTGRTEVYVRNVATSSIVRASLAPGGVATNGPNRSPSLDRDGSHVAFLSTAPNLGATNQGLYEGFVRELASGVTTKISYSSTGGHPDTSLSAIDVNGDGTFVAFSTSASNIAPATASPGQHIFVYDVAAGSTTQVDLDANGSAPSNAAQSAVDIDAGGGRVAFLSSATDLLPEPTAGQLAFVRDWPVNGVTIGDVTVTEPDALQAKVAFLVTSRRAAPTAIPVDWEVVSGTAGAKDVVLAAGTTTIDAGKVSATVTATVKGDTLLESDETFTVRIKPHGQVATRGTATGTLLDGTLGMFATLEQASGFHALSGDGRFLTYFADTGTNPNQPHYRLTQRNLVTGVDRRLLDPKLETGEIYSSDDGRWIALVSRISLDAANPHAFGQENIYLVDAKLKAVRRVSIAPDPAYHRLGGLSADGRYVSLDSTKDLAGGGAALPHPRAFVYDAASSTTTLVSLADNGTAFDAAVAGPISADGRYVTFEAGFNGTAGPHCTNGIATPVWRRDRIANKTTLVTPYDTAATSSACDANPVAISGDGTRVFVYYSVKSGYFDVAGESHLYVRNGATGAGAQVPHPDSNGGTRYGNSIGIDRAGNRFSMSFADTAASTVQVVEGTIDGGTTSPVEDRAELYIQTHLSADGRIATACGNASGVCHVIALPR